MEQGRRTAQESVRDMIQDLTTYKIWHPAGRDRGAGPDPASPDPVRCDQELGRAPAQGRGLGRGRGPDPRMTVCGTVPRSRVRPWSCSRSPIPARGETMIFDLSVTSGLAHCHARGLYSIVLQTAPMVRLFYAAPDHALYRNQTGRVVGFHAHHCNLTLIPVFGQITNVFGQRQNLRPTAKDYTERKVVDTRAFWYQSVITGGVRSGAGFRAISPTIPRSGSGPAHARCHDHGRGRAAHDRSGAGQDAAWVVFEGGGSVLPARDLRAPLCGPDPDLVRWHVPAHARGRDQKGPGPGHGHGPVPDQNWGLVGGWHERGL